MAQPIRNQRAHARAPFRDEVRYFEWDRARTGHAREISEGGLFLGTQAPPAEGKLLTLRIQLPGEPAFTALAQVVRTVHGGPLREAGMGLKFVDLPTSARATIARHVGARAAA